jgi:hypothetical protein
MSEYRKILDNSIFITRLLSNLKFDNKKLAEELIIPTTGVSLWSIYEVILTIHCFPRLNKYLYWTRTIHFIKRIRNRITIFLKNTSSQNNEIYKLNTNDKILFLGFTKYLAKENFASIFDLLNVDNLYSPIVITDGNTSDFGINNNLIVDINCLTNDYINSSQKNISDHLDKILTEITLKSKKLNINNKEFTNFKEAISFIKLYSNNLVPKYLSIAFYIFNRFPPKAIISIDVADPRTRIFTLLANQFNIPVIQLQAGPIDEDCVEWQFFYDNIVLANGIKGQLALEAHSVPSHRIAVVGSAKHESVLNFRNISSYNLRNLFKISSSKKIILLISSYTELFYTNSKFTLQLQVFENMYNSIIKGIENRSNLVLIIKPHPLEKLNKLARIAKDNERIYVANSNDNTIKLVSCADAVITFGSTSTVDSLLLNKFTICPQFDGWIGEYFQNSGSVAVPKNENEFDQLFELIEKNKFGDLLESMQNSRQEFLNDISFGLGVGSTRRIVDQIYGLIDSSSYP